MNQNASEESLPESGGEEQPGSGGIVPSGGPPPPDPRAMADFVGMVAGPFVDASNVGQKESTKRARIWAEVTKFAIGRALWVVVGLIVLAGVAIVAGHPEFAVNLVVAVVGFAAGLGFGRSNQPPTSD